MAETLIERLRKPVMLHSNPEQTNAERREAADAIERMEAEIERLRNTCQAYGGRVSADGDAIERMQKALEPFAKYADPNNRLPADFQISHGSKFAGKQLTMGDCYAARAALSSTMGKP